MMQFDDVMLARLRDPETPAEELVTAWKALQGLGIALESHPAYEALASNPNTPPDLFFGLAYTCPDLVLANPVLPLLAIADPQLECISHLGLRVLYEYRHLASAAIRAVVEAAWAERKRRFGLVTSTNLDGETTTEEPIWFDETLPFTPDYVIVAVRERLQRP